MYIRTLISVLIVTSSFILAFGQDAPKAEKEKEKAAAARSFAWSFNGDGGYLGIQTKEVNSENFASFGRKGRQIVQVSRKTTFSEIDRFFGKDKAHAYLRGPSHELKFDGH